MTDEQRAAIESGIAAMEHCGWTHRVPVLRALLSASKPAAPMDDYAERLELSKALCRIINNTGMAVWQIEAIERAAKMLAAPAAPAHCQCAACKTGAIHASDCSVHNAPALPVRECDCGVAPPAQTERAMTEDARDAARYRALRDFGKDGVNINPPCEHVHACAYTHAVGTTPATRVVNGDELDRLCDASRAASPQPVAQTTPRAHP